MPSYQVTVPHTLGQPAARSRVEQFLVAVERDYAEHIRDVQGQWSDNALHFGFVATGMKINGTLVVADNQVQVSGPLPLMAAFFRGRIEQTIREELQKLLS
jgi:Putative polyhydroxyalkanoic acid system protein (PHA_gran_rgn)